VQDAAKNLGSSDKWQVYKASVANDKIASVTTGTSAVPGSFSLEVNQLASPHKLVSGSIATGSAVGGGTLTFAQGSFEAGTNTFTANPDKTPVAVTIPANATLAQTRDAINQANAGVTAVLVRDGSGERLSITSKDSGAGNSLKITASDADGVDTDGTGLSQLAYDPAAAAGAGKNLSQTQAAQDALALVDGVNVRSASNTLTNVIDGVTLALKATTGGTPTTVDVASDTDTVKKRVEDFTKAYNDLSNLVKDLTKYDAATRRGGDLQGDRTVIGIQQQMRSLMQDTMTGAGAGDFTRLADIGLSVQTDGNLRLDSTKFNEAASANFGKIARLFANEGNAATPSTQGFATRLKDISAKLLDSEGVVTTRQQGMRDSIKLIDKQQEAFNTRLALTERRLREQYTALDNKMSTLSGTSSYLSQQLAAMSNNSR
jgi:flagellar hook-associated protein 2